MINWIKSMMNKKTAALLCALIMVVLQGCSLIDTPSTDPERVFGEDYMVGLLISNTFFEGGMFLDDEDSTKDTIRMFIKQEDMHGHTVSMLDTSESLANVNYMQTNNGAAPGGKLALTATLYYTYELLSANFNVLPVYVNAGNKNYVKDDFNSYVTNGITVSTTITQNLKSNITTAEGVEEITYEGKFTVSLEYIDYLTKFNIIEFDASHSIINTHAVDLGYAGDSYDYKTSVNCEYILVEEEYEVMGDRVGDGSKKGDKYFERKIFNRSDTLTNIPVYRPAGDGYLDIFNLALDFA